MTSRRASVFYFRGDSLLLYRRLWKHLFENIELLTELKVMIRQIISKATNRQESLYQMKAAMQAIGLDEKTHIRDQLERRLRFYASAFEI